MPCSSMSRPRVRRRRGGLGPALGHLLPLSAGVPVRRRAAARLGAPPRARARRPPARPRVACRWRPPARPARGETQRGQGRAWPLAAAQVRGAVAQGAAVHRLHGGAVRVPTARLAGVRAARRPRHVGAPVRAAGMAREGDPTDRARDDLDRVPGRRAPHHRRPRGIRRRRRGARGHQRRQRRRGLHRPGERTRGPFLPHGPIIARAASSSRTAGRGRPNAPSRPASPCASCRSAATSSTSPAAWSWRTPACGCTTSASRPSASARRCRRRSASGPGPSASLTASLRRAAPPRRPTQSRRSRRGRRGDRRALTLPGLPRPPVPRPAGERARTGIRSRDSAAVRWRRRCDGRTAARRARPARARRDAARGAVGLRSSDPTRPGRSLARPTPLEGTTTGTSGVPRAGRVRDIACV